MRYHNIDDLDAATSASAGQALMHIPFVYVLNNCC